MTRHPARPTGSRNPGQASGTGGIIRHAFPLSRLHAAQRSLFHRAKHIEPTRPETASRRTARPTMEGPALMWEEYVYFKAAGLLDVWRLRWQAFLAPPCPIDDFANG